MRMFVRCILCVAACISFASGKYISNDNTTAYVEHDQACDCGVERTCSFREDGTKVCACIPGFSLKGGKCEACDCGIQGTCRFRDDGSKVCDCNRGFISINGKCEDPCTSNLCRNDGACVLNGTDFLCECKNPYFGKLCQFHPCHSNPCANNGACIAVENDFGCVCREPFRGKLCEIDPCSSGPCMNGGECSVAGVDFNCTCAAPFSGRQCQWDPCTSNPCKNNGSCFDDNGKYYCMCKMPFFGDHCENQVDVTTEMAVNASTADITSRHELTTILDGEFNNTLTEINRTVFFTTEQVTINDDCYCGKNSLNCYFYRGNKLCKCKANYAQKNGTCMKTCQYNLDCLNGGVCRRVQGGGYFCDCSGVYVGERCEVDVCRHVRCEATHVCRRRGDTGVCECPEGKYLSRAYTCEDVCNYDTCVHGYCTMIAGTYECACNNGFTGRKCDKKMTQVTDTVPFTVLFLILSVGIVIFASAAIIAVCWVKRLNDKLQKR